MSQNDAILGYLKSGRWIDQKIAAGKLGCYRLASRIYDLRKRGLDIDERTLYSGSKHWSAYRLAQKD